ncbi:uncharacterized protein [Panulirus ornatus]|uniref:uncharacterized protein n=1 Tax=Panulirus ornatus TaxID=150431 RepID=UPI003A8BAA46
MVCSTVTLFGSVLLWAGYHTRSVLSNTEYTSAAPNSIAFDDKEDIIFFLEPYAENKPSLKYYFRLYHPSSVQQVVHHSEKPLSHSSYKLLVSKPNIKSLPTLFTVKKAFQDHGKQHGNLEKIRELDVELKGNYHRTQHTIHRRDLKLLGAQKIQKRDVTKIDVVNSKNQKLNVRERYSKGPSNPANRTNNKTVTETEHFDNADRNDSSLHSFLNNSLFRSHEKHENQKESHIFSSVGINNMRGKKDKKATGDEHFIDIIKKYNTSIDGVGYKNSPLETLYSLVSFVSNQEHELGEKRVDFTKKHNISQGKREEDIEVNVNGIEVYNLGNINDQNLIEGEHKEKKTLLRDLLMGFGLNSAEESPLHLISNVDQKMSSQYFIANSSYNVPPFTSVSFAKDVEMHKNIESLLSLNNNNSDPLQHEEENVPVNEKEQRSSDWMSYVITATAVVVALVLISLSVMCGAKLYRSQRNKKQQMLEILQPSGI